MATGKGPNIADTTTETTTTSGTTDDQSQSQLASEIAEPGKNIADRSTQAVDFRFLHSLENFKGGLDDACEIAEMGGEIPIEDVPGFEELEDNKEAQKRGISEFFDIDLSKPTIVKTYETEGTPGTPGEGKIKVDVIQTNIGRHDVFIGRWTYDDGSIGWTVRALEVENQE